LAVRQLRRALRAEALRRAELPRPVAPVTGRMRYPPYLPGAAPGREDQAVSLARSASLPGKVTGTGAERRALSGSAPPASTVLRIRAARGHAFGAPLTPEPLPPQRA